MIILKSERDLEAMRPACAVARLVQKPVNAVDIVGRERVLDDRSYPLERFPRSHVVSPLPSGQRICGNY